MSESGGGVDDLQPSAPATQPTAGVVTDTDRSSEAAQERPSADGSALSSRELAVAIRNGLRLGSSLILTWAVALIVKLQIPAHLGPVLQGHFAFAESFAMIFFSFIGLGIDTHVVKEVSVRPAYASEFIGGIFALRTVLSVGLFVVMATILQLTGRSDDILVAAMIFGVGFFLASLNGTLAAVLQAVSQVGRLAIASVLSKLIWGAGVLVGLYYNAPIWMLAVPMASAELLKVLVLVPSATTAALLRYRIDVRAAGAAIVASVPFFVNGVAITFGNYLALSALEFIRQDEREVGWFAASQNIASLATLLQPLLMWVVMPMLSRAHARSVDEMTRILRRAIEGLLIVIAPGTAFISAGSDVLIDLAFGAKYAPAALGLSILSLVFLMMYMNFLLACALILNNRGWTVTMISIGSVCGLATMMLICVPAGRQLFGVGGECAGAAIAVILSEACVVAVMLTRFAQSPLDGRNVAVLLKSLAISGLCLALNHAIVDLGAVRLVFVVAAYLLLALVLRVIRPQDIQRVIKLVKERRAE